MYNGKAMYKHCADPGHELYHGVVGKTTGWILGAFEFYCADTPGTADACQPPRSGFQDFGNDAISALAIAFVGRVDGTLRGDAAVPEEAVNCKTDPKETEDQEEEA